MGPTPAIVVSSLILLTLILAWTWPWYGTANNPGIIDGHEERHVAIDPTLIADLSLEEQLQALATAYLKWQQAGMLDAFKLESAADFMERRRLANNFLAANKAAQRRLEELDADQRLIRIRELDNQFALTAIELFDHLEATLTTWNYDPVRSQVQFDRDEDIELFNAKIIRLGDIKKRQQILIEEMQNEIVP